MTQLNLTKEVYEAHPSALLPILTEEKNKKSGAIIVQSKRTGKDYTLRVARSEWNDLWYTHIWLEKGGYQQYEHIGYLAMKENGPLNLHIKKDGKKVNIKAAKALCWVFTRVFYKMWKHLLDEVTIMHSGSCMACGRELTDAESIKRGVGPVCADNYNIKTRR